MVGFKARMKATFGEINQEQSTYSSHQLSSVPKRFVDNYSRSPANQPSAPTTATPTQQHRTTDDGHRFARRGPLTTTNDNRGLVKDFVLFANRSTPIAYWKACGDGHFYVTDLCHGFILGYSWLERHNPRINWVSRMVEFDSSYCLENCCDGSSRIQGLGKPPDTSKTFELPLAPDSTSTPVELSPIFCSLSDSISLESMQADVYPFVEVSPVSDVSVPPDILSSFSSLFSEDQAETLPPHR
ncbi:hypothetical protein BASA83_002455 [Batrachochytrium salamandrivorans]|nr:hypothetical protein BASA83_002455 [Batrachochytrium salamandrivorans]